MSSRSPTGRGLKYFFQLLAQSSSLTSPVSTSCGIPAAVYRSRRKATASAGFSSGEM